MQPPSPTTTPPPGHCPNCHTPGMSVFYRVARVPVHSVLLMETREQARNYPTGDIQLGFCHTCGFISNLVFDPSLHEYSSKYEATQSYSPTFNKFHRTLAQNLIERHNLRGKDIIEIGCGQGEFLILLCEMGNNYGIGFDPAYNHYPLESEARERITFVKDFYSEKYTHVQGDFVVCKMTLEHIPNTAEFVGMVRRAVGDRPETTIFFQIPSVRRILHECAFWDIYYEHCSYFSRESLTYLFEHAGFEVLRVAEEYDHQYLTIEARPRLPTQPAPPPPPTAELARQVQAFAQNVPQKLAWWREKLQHIRANGQRAVIWGGGSKGVAFLTTLDISDEIGCAVDINPKKHGTFMAGSGHEIVAPEFLRHYRPDVVIIMNPIYRAEISRDLQRMGLHPEILTVE